MSTPPPTSQNALYKSACELHQQGKLKDAYALYTRVLQQDSKHVPSLHMLGVMALQMGQHERAAELLLRVVRLAPDVAPYLCNLGEALRGKGALAEALASFEKALKLDGSLVQAHLRRGEILFSLQRHKDGLTAVQQSVALDPAFIDGWFGLGQIFRQMGRFDDALAALRRVVELDPRHQKALHAISLIHSSQGRYEDAMLAYEQELAVRPALITPKLGIAKTLKRLVPEWHVPMMNEGTRNDAYEAALKAVLKTDHLVLEIGTGAGLLALMCARLGASQVITCESVPLIASTAQEIIRDNGFQDQITVIPKKSTELKVGTDLPERADVLVSEIFSSELLAEFVLPSMEDACRRLIKPDAIVIPCSGTLMCALAGGAELARYVWVDKVSGFDMRRFNTLRARKKVLHDSDAPVVLQSVPEAAFTFDFKPSATFKDESRVLTLQATSACLCYGVLQWIRFELLPGFVYENHPNDHKEISGWQRCIYLFEEPLLLGVGDKVQIRADHDRKAPWFELVGHEPGDPDASAAG